MPQPFGLWTAPGGDVGRGVEEGAGSDSEAEGAEGDELAQWLGSARAG
ncbi:hypothetical protein ACIGMX_05985 [Streptomyces aquilus]